MKKNKDSEAKWGYVNIWYLLIPLAVLMVVFIFPLCYMLYMSFFEFEGVGKALGAFTLENYTKFFTSAYYWRVLGVTILLGLISTVICVVIGYPIAYKISRMTGNVRHLFNTITMLTLWVAITVRMFGWMNLTSATGLLNRIITFFTGQSVTLLGSYASVELGLVYCGLPYFIMIMTGPLENIHPSLEEASYVFGAGFFKTFFKVTLPMTWKAAMSGAVLVFALNTAAFVVPVMLGNGKITVMTNLIYSRATYNYDWGFAAALSMIFMVTSLLITNLGNMFSRKKKT